MRIKLEYLCQPPKKHTFEMPRLKQWVAGWCHGNVLNLFAGNTMLIPGETRNDIDPSANAEFHMDAHEFVKTWDGNKFDTVVLDPPYNMRKSREKYGDRHIGDFTLLKNELLRIINLGSNVITLGYDSVGMSASRGFEKIAICIVCHGGDHNDTLCVVESYVVEQQNLNFNGDDCVDKTQEA